MEIFFYSVRQAQPEAYGKTIKIFNRVPPRINLDWHAARRSVSAVLARLSKLAVILALVATVGLHWVALQTVAWTTMLADNLQSTSVEEAFVKTFDGKHPCPLCKAIAAGKKSERKNESTAPLQKFEFPPTTENVVLIVRAQFDLLPPANVRAHTRSQRPPTPPPRNLPA
ncbi:MAG TPA: hypothetical protein VGH42_03895 [Verrucomicrobiae bacterium]